MNDVREMELKAPLTAVTGWRRLLTAERRKLLLRLIKVLVSAALIYWILRGTELGAIFAAVSAANPWLLILAFSLHMVGFTISAIRWQTLLRAQGTEASIPFLIESSVVGVFFNNFLPSTVGGDAYRARDSWRLGQSKSGAVAVVFVDRFLGLLALVMFALLSALAANELTTNLPGLQLWVALGLLGMLVFIWAIFMPPRQMIALLDRVRLPFWGKIRQIIDAFLAFQGQRGVLARALFWSIVLQANVVVHYFLISEALGLAIPIYNFFLIIPLATIIMMLPISVNAIGIRENVFVFFFAAFGIAKPEAVAFAWLAFGMVVLQGVIGGLLYALRR